MKPRSNDVAVSSPMPAPSPTLPSTPSAFPRPQGLSGAEAAARLAHDGPNRISPPRVRRLHRIVLDALREPMFALLLAAVGLYFFIGDTAEAIFLLLGAMATIALVVVQEARSEKALAALRLLAEPPARVIRDGRELKVPAGELVRGDLVMIGEGSRSPADMMLVGRRRDLRR
jgi:P-type Ca2+ transporter type 2C